MGRVVYLAGPMATAVGVERTYRANGGAAPATGVVIVTPLRYRRICGEPSGEPGQK